MTKTFEPKKFNLSELKGISNKTMEEHLGLYAGYVKSFNGICELMGKLMTDEANGPALAELQRRLSFEFGGMRLHEYYFAQFEGGANALTAGSALEQKMIEQFGGVEAVKKFMKNVALMRGPGWAVLYYDKQSGNLMFGFSGEQHQGHFVGLPIVMCIDVWEHAFILDYGATGRGAYIDAFFKNLNWSVIEKRFAALSSWKPE